MRMSGEAAARLATIAAAFAPLRGQHIEKVLPIGGGHINDTFRVEVACGAFVLQRINRQVFPRPRDIVENTLRVSAHVRASEPALVAEQFVTRDGQAGHSDAAGDVWRLSALVAGAPLSRLSTSAQASAAGYAFGAFQSALADFPVAQLHEAIAGFHDLDLRLRAFDAAVDAASAGIDPVLRERHRDVAPLRAFVEATRGRLVRLHTLGGADAIHADCKLSNLLFDADGERVAAVVDLDTVMAGARATDFGDLARSAAGPAHEDCVAGPLTTPLARDPRADINVDCFRALAHGYLAAAGHLRPSAEPATLVDATLTVTFMLGVRFLTDYLQGDRYFRCQRADQNRDRAATQFQLAAALLVRQGELERALRAF